MFTFPEYLLCIWGGGVKTPKQEVSAILDMA